MQNLVFKSFWEKNEGEKFPKAIGEAQGNAKFYLCLRRF